jgi:hypothetical protein
MAVSIDAPPPPPPPVVEPPPPEPPPPNPVATMHVTSMGQRQLPDTVTAYRTNVIGGF